MSKTILLDGDIVAYQFAAAAEKETDWGGGLRTLHSREQDAIPPMEDFLDTLRDDLDADRMVIALTDGVNWRKDVLPSYKHNRSDKRKPLILPVVRQHLLDKYEAFLRPTLEGDDVLGILMTHPTLVKGDKVLVSIDKDMKTIPGSHYHMREGRHFTVTPEEAALYHFTQTLTGDTTDGYSGCPGIGPKKAEGIIQAAIEEWRQKGDVTDFNQRNAFIWQAIVKVFEKAKLGPEEALTQARVARICHACDYDFKAKKVRLWTPTT